jgi:ribonuclease P protein component
MENRLTKQERLNKQNAIQALFKKGTSLKARPFKTLFIVEENDAEAPVRVLFVVPKRNLKLAVDRNKMKRLMREVYRKNKSGINEAAIAAGKSVTLALIFTSNKPVAYSTVEDKIILILQRLQKTLINETSNS